MRNIIPAGVDKGTKNLLIISNQTETHAIPLIEITKISLRSEFLLQIDTKSENYSINGEEKETQDLFWQLITLLSNFFSQGA